MDLRDALQWYGNDIIKTDPLRQESFKYSEPKWKFWFGAIHDDPEVREAVKHFEGKISREKIFDFVESATPKSILTAAFMWGYRSGRGTLFLHAALSDGRVEEILGAAADKLSSETWRVLTGPSAPLITLTSPVAASLSLQSFAISIQRHQSLDDPDFLARRL